MKLLKFYKKDLFLTCLPGLCFFSVFAQDKPAYKDARSGIFVHGGDPTVTWIYEVPEAGEYNIEMDYALNKCYAGLPVDILIDHKKQLTFTTEETGGDSICKKISVGTERLEKEKQDIAFDSGKSNEARIFVMQQLKGICLTKK